MSQEKKSSFKPIKSAGLMKKIMGDYFTELKEAAEKGSPKIAWCTSVGPAELLRAFGFLVYFPENHGALLGATRMAMDLIPAANAIGYSPDICSYLTSDVGSYLKKSTPLARAFGMESVPKPDVLVYNTNQCRDVKDWMEFYHREFNVPIVGIDTPRGIGDLTETHLDAVTNQLKEMVPVLEKVAGKPLDMAELERVTDLSKQCTELWKKVLRSATHVPSPITFFDGTIHMGPAVVLRGHQRALDYYEALTAELDERIKEGVAAVDGEEFRIYWEGMPIWGKLREHAEQFMGLKSCVVASTYCNSWIFEDLDDKDPFRSMAKAYTALFITRSEEYKEGYLERMLKDYQVSGVLFHDSKTCPNNSNCRYGMQERIKTKTGVPTLTINGDLNDLRCYSEEQARTNIEAFVEQLKS
ncbi:MAG: 2-hydroxyacyl-CoA dehydratase subunit D [Planctomycetota bacterium]|jgi:benzoyl-CoA reductase/2-hydroxyglutaryl-CoA dehydratase subunit BcrC/BadD/HgdB